MTKQKVHATDWRNRDICDWNTTTFRTYLTEQHEEKFGIPYVTNSIPREAGAMKNFAKEHGNEVLKRFIDICLDNYTPSNQYPSVNFMFMYSYMRERILPQVYGQLKTEKTKDAGAETTESMEIDDALDWL